MRPIRLDTRAVLLDARAYLLARALRLRACVCLACVCVAFACACAGRATVETVPTPPDIGLAAGWSDKACTRAAVDPDRDGLDQRCELALARAFAPLLVVREGGCNWDDVARPNRLGGGYMYAVEREPGHGRVRIAYLPAYYRDCGWDGPKCWVPLVDCAAHAGDSEAIMIEVAYTRRPARWRTVAVFLSAHCFGRRSRGCRWYRASALQAFEWVQQQRRGAPVVWVAEGRQANYPTRVACDRGHLFLDTCDRNNTRVRFPIRSARQNIGSRRAPIGGDGCVRTDALTGDRQLVVPGSTECFWSPTRRFRGWQSIASGDGTTPYHRYLAAVAKF